MSIRQRSLLRLSERPESRNLIREIIRILQKTEMGFCIVYFANRRNLQKNILRSCTIQKNVVSLHHF